MIYTYRENVALKSQVWGSLTLTQLLLNNLFRPFFLPAIHLNPQNGVSSIERTKAYMENWADPNIAFLRISILIPVSWENGDPQNRGPLSPFYREYGDGIPIFPVKRGSGSPFYQEYGDPLAKIGIPGDPIVMK